MVFAFPAPRVIPFEEFPSSAAVPHHCGRCLLAVAARSPCPDCPTWWSSATRVPSAEASGSESSTCAGRGPCQYALFQSPRRSEVRVPPAAEAPGGARAASRRSAWWCVRPRRPKPSWTLVPCAAGAVRGGLTSPPKRTASRSGLRRPVGRRPGPEGPGVPTVTEVVVGIHRPPRWRDGSGEPGLCLGDAPIRRSGPPRHQTGLKSTGKPAASAPCPRASPPPEGGGLSCGRASLQSGRGHAEPRRPKPRGSTPPPHRSIWRLRRCPLPGLVVNATPMEQSTSGLYSADESVETHRRFQRCVTRVSHGLGSPSRFYLLLPPSSVPLRAEARRFPVSRRHAGKPARFRLRRSRCGESLRFVPLYPSAGSPRRRVLPPKR
jgi:hypothetical protein